MGDPNAVDVLRPAVMAQCMSSAHDVAGAIEREGVRGWCGNCEDTIDDVLAALRAAVPGDGPLVIRDDGTITRPERIGCPICLGGLAYLQAGDCVMCAGSGSLYRIPAEEGK